MPIYTREDIKNMSNAYSLDRPLILASGSPRRRELLQKMGVPFVVEVSEADENVSGKPSEVVGILAARKARAVAKNHISGLILAADTLVSLDDAALGKPCDEQEAVRMLKSLSGRAHSVYTGICLLDAATGEEKICVEESRVFFRELSDQEIADYVATKEPMDKAGAYAIQGGAARFVSRFEGSYHNIVGLPTERLEQLLKEY